MMDICQKFASSHNLQFSTNGDPVKSMTKCIHFSRKKATLTNIFLNGNRLAWVESANHVGNVLERNNSFTLDIKNKSKHHIKGIFFCKPHNQTESH